jgi:DNA ligase (NAD+)
LNFDEALILAQKLRDSIKYHNKKYYEDDDPEIEDSKFDELKRKLEKLEEKFPQIINTNSPTQIVGGNASEKFSQVKHEIKMESLHDSFSYEEIFKFYDRVIKTTGEIDFIVEPKVDGISLSIEYKNGIFWRASTRGNGIIGEDITENVFYVRNLPHNLPEKVSYLEVRGECYMPRIVFEELVKNQELKGEKVFKNPRNAASGSLRQKDASKIPDRKLEILFFNIQQAKDINLKNHKDSLEYIKKLKLPTINYAICKNKNEIIKEIESIGNKRFNFDFQVDGAVLKINSFEKRNLLGSTSSFPRWAEAFKYIPEEKKAKLINIEISIGRTGVLTPVAIFNPISLAGTTVSRATLHNEDFIKEKKISIGDIISVRKAGDIIPEVVCVDSKNNNNNLIFKMPKKCPFCGSKIFHKEKEIAFKCINALCPERTLAQIMHFASRDAMDIEGLGETTIKILQKDLKNISDIYRLNENILKKYPVFIENNISEGQEFIPGFGTICLKKTGRNLLNSIKKSKSALFGDLIYALGIPYVGKEAAGLLAKKFKNSKKLIHASMDKILEINGIGTTTANSIIEFFIENPEILFDLEKLGIKIYNSNIQTEKSRDKSNDGTTFKTSRLKFVLTGSLEKFTRAEAKKQIEKLNGKVTSNVTSQTSYLLCGEKPGKKLQQAEELNVKILTEEEFLNMI